MVRKAKSRRSVDLVGVKKHKIFSRSIKKNIFDKIESLIPRKHVVSLYKLSENLFNLYLRICCKLNFIQVSIDSEGNVSTAKKRWEVVSHYAVLVLQLARMLYMIVVSVSMTLSGAMDMNTFLCICSLMPYIVSFLLSTSLLLQPQETAQILNVSKIIFQFYPNNGKVTTMFRNAKNTTFIIASVLISSCVVLTSSVFGFAVPRHPVSLYFLVELVFGRPEFIQKVWWKLLFWPLEVIMYGHSMAITCLAAMMLLTMPNIGLVCTHEMRKMRVTSAESWMELREKYYLYQVHNCLINIWVKLMVVPGILATSSTIILCLYIAIRHTEIPIAMYLGVSGVGVAVFTLLFWFGFEVIAWIQSTEAIVATLNARGERYFLELLPPQRLYLTKYGKATRPANFRIGNFVDYSIDVLISIWEEILNQLLFLLTF